MKLKKRTRKEEKIVIHHQQNNKIEGECFDTHLCRSLFAIAYIQSSDIIVYECRSNVVVSDYFYILHAHVYKYNII